jgi:DNA repair protein RecO (recombination protein O)
MHHIYHTEGFILGSRNFGEAGKCYYIFTRELGMIYASAQGVRKVSSKLRYVLQDFSYINVDLVRGKDFWRVTSASKKNLLEGMSKDRETFGILVNIARLLKRLLPGEDTNQILFDDLIKGFGVLEKSKKVEEMRNTEVIIILRLLSNLGYIGGNEKIMSLVRSPFEEDMVFEVAKSRAEILREINKALKETHL